MEGDMHPENRLTTMNRRDFLRLGGAGLAGATLLEAAKLTGLSEARLKNDRSANIEGGAAFLSDLLGKPKPKRLDGWREALTRYAGTDLYANQVYGVLKSGASLTISTGERLKLSAQDVEVPQLYTAKSG